ncbi:MAG: hypothetical protein P8078_10335 [bacterium]
MSDILKGDPWESYKKHYQYINKRFKLITDYIKDDIHSGMDILDIGQQNPFTLFMQKELNVTIKNLDVYYYSPKAEIFMDKTSFS